MLGIPFMWESRSGLPKPLVEPETEAKLKWLFIIIPPVLLVYRQFFLMPMSLKQGKDRQANGNISTKIYICNVHYAKKVSARRVLLDTLL